MHGVGVHAEAFDAGESGADLGFEALGAQPAIADSDELAGGAIVGCFDLIVAIVAESNFLGAVMGEGDLALGTSNDFAAGRTLDVGGEPATVEEEDDLSALADGFADGLVEKAVD